MRFKNEKTEVRSKDMPASPEGEYYREVNWLAIFVFIIMVILVLNVAFLYPTIAPALFYQSELLASAFLWQRLSFLPLWIGVGILLFAWGPFTIFKPVLTYEGKNHWYYKVRGPDRGLYSFYLYRNLGKQPIVIYKAFLKKRGLNYYVQSNDLVTEPGKRPNLIVVESQTAGEVSEILKLEKENRELKIQNQKLWREVRLAHAPSIDLVLQTMRTMKGGSESTESASREKK